MSAGLKRTGAVLKSIIIKAVIIKAIVKSKAEIAAGALINNNNNQ